ncbi:hypothetical protein [Bradyrhizobium sp. BR 10289]|uniref:hypothetical protein n=1 Tax=Bradyrhizobium sp. BR 10289 TaxID=2749993 RepID=UPI001C652597|nr:hypothetical protein [Bradyrhizobium sp. BR 10289]MBW7973266.1 hypothetical protein [Bradyrhizobium sp. BR 10289]
MIIAMIHLAPLNQALLLVLIAACLGSCLIRAFWELEQARARRVAMRRSRTTKRD